MRRLTILLAALAALMLVPAAQAFAAPTVSVTIEGNGAGEVSSVGGFEGSGLIEGEPPIECTYVSPGPAEGECESEATAYSGVEGVVLHEIAAEGSEFAGWTHTAVGGAGCNEIAYECKAFGAEGEYTGDEITATFEPATESAEQPLTLKVNSGSGTTVSNPAGIECTGSSGETCTSEFEEGAEVTLTASPAAGYRFYNWAACPGTTNGRQCTVTMSAAKEAKVNFIKTWKLTVSKSSGSVPGILKVLPSPASSAPTSATAPAIRSPTGRKSNGHPL